MHLTPFGPSGDDVVSVASSTEVESFVATTQRGRYGEGLEAAATVCRSIVHLPMLLRLVPSLMSSSGPSDFSLLASASRHWCCPMEDKKAAPMKSCHSVMHMYLMCAYTVACVCGGGGGGGYSRFACRSC